MSLGALGNNVIKADKTHVATPHQKPETTPKPTTQHHEVKHNTQESNANIHHKPSSTNVKHSVSIVGEKKHEGHEESVLHKAREEALVKSGEKGTIHAVEHIAGKAFEKAGEKAIGQAVLTEGVNVAEKLNARHAPKIIQKSSKVLAKALGKIEQNTAGKAVTGTFKAVGHSMEHNVGKVMKTGAKIADKVSANGFSKGVVKLTEKIGAKTAGRLAAFVPFAGVAVGAVITKSDLADYRAKSKDPNVTRTSKVLAGATVGLDVISTGASAVAAFSAGTVVGAPVAAVAEGVSWVATGLSIATSVGSEVFKNKKH